MFRCRYRFLSPAAILIPCYHQLLWGRHALLLAQKAFQLIVATLLCMCMDHTLIKQKIVIKHIFI